MPDPDPVNQPFQPRPTPAPMRRVSLSNGPLPRANYGLPTASPSAQPEPPRPVAPAPPAASVPANMGITSMDIITPPSAPVQPPRPVAPALTSAPAAPSVPLDQPKPSSLPAAAPVDHLKPKRHRLRTATWLLGVVLCVVGAGLWLMSGGLSKQVVTTGAIVSSSLDAARGVNTFAVRVQFTATDGQTHNLVFYSHQPATTSGLSPGDAERVVYKPGQPDTTARRWSTVSRPRDAGLAAMGLGVILLLVTALMTFKRRKSSAKPVRLVNAKFNL